MFPNSMTTLCPTRNPTTSSPSPFSLRLALLPILLPFVLFWFPPQVSQLQFLSTLLFQAIRLSLWPLFRISHCDGCQGRMGVGSVGERRGRLKPKHSARQKSSKSILSLIGHTSLSATHHRIQPSTHRLRSGTVSCILPTRNDSTLRKCGGVMGERRGDG